MSIEINSGKMSVSTAPRIHDRSTDDSVLMQGMHDIQYELKLPPAFPPEVEADPVRWVTCFTLAVPPG